MTKTKRALKILERFGQFDGEHHKAWVIDQVARALHGCKLIDIDAVETVTPEYTKWVKEMRDGADGPDSYGYDEGIAP